jgi:thiamine-monophosphate kinase
MHPFTKSFDESVSARGESALIRDIQRWLGPASPRAPFGIGDDCAVLPPVRGRQLLTVDPVVYGRHFDDSIPARAVAAKLLKRNLSDLAAMGAKPTAAVIALTLDARVSLRWVEEFYRGLATAARRYRVPIVGGDIAQADGVIIAGMTLLGAATAPRVLTRSGARIKDYIYVTGKLGGSLRTGHHWKFIPRLAEGAWLVRRPEVRAMMDLSDGLAKDLPALTPKHTVAVLDAAGLPRRAGCDLAGALADGEDYELLFTVNFRANLSAFERAWRKKFPRVPLTRIGHFARTLPAGAPNLADYHGYEHLR